jgi:hypothetical protein
MVNPLTGLTGRDSSWQRVRVNVVAAGQILVEHGHE